MKNFSKHILIAGILGFFAVSAAQAETRVTPFVGVAATYTDSGYDERYGTDSWAPGATLEGGVVVNDRHTFTLGVNYTEWEMDPTLIAGISYMGNEITQTSITLGYRYDFTVEKLGGIKVSLGPTVGMLHESQTFDVNAPGFGITNTEKESEWLPTYGGELVISKAFANGWSVQTGVQLLIVKAHTYTHLSGVFTENFDKTERLSYHVGVSYSW